MALFGNNLVSHDTTGRDTLLGPVNGAARATFATNRNATAQTAIVTQETDYYVLQGSTLTLQEQANLPAPNSVCYVKGQFVFGISDGRIFASSVNDITVSAASYGSANSKSDSLVKVYEFLGLLYVFKTTGTEIWQADPNLAASPFSFSPAQQDIDFGLSAVHSVAKYSGDLIWIDQHGVVRMGRDQGAQVISNKYIELLIASVPNDQRNQIYGSIVSDLGNKLYVLRAPGWCVQYDPAGKPSWYERESLQLPTWRASQFEQFAGRNICGSSDAGALYFSDPSNHMDGPSPQVMELWCPHLHKFPGWLSVRRLSLDVISGNAPLNGLPENVSPHLMIDYSDDGGHTFKGERQVSTGEAGEYAKTVDTRNWGMVRAKGRIWRFRASPAVLKCIQGAMVAGGEVRAWRA